MVKVSSYKDKELGYNKTEQLFKSHMSRVILNQDTFDGN